MNNWSFFLDGLWTHFLLTDGSEINLRVKKHQQDSHQLYSKSDAKTLKCSNSGGCLFFRVGCGLNDRRLGISAQMLVTLKVIKTPLELVQLMTLNEWNRLRNVLNTFTFILGLFLWKLKPFRLLSNHFNILGQSVVESRETEKVLCIVIKANNWRKSN